MVSTIGSPFEGRRTHAQAARRADRADYRSDLNAAGPPRRNSMVSAATKSRWRRPGARIPQWPARLAVAAGRARREQTRLVVGYSSWRSPGPHQHGHDGAERQHASLASRSAASVPAVAGPLTRPGSGRRGLDQSELQLERQLDLGLRRRRHVARDHLSACAVISTRATGDRQREVQRPVDDRALGCDLSTGED